MQVKIERTQWAEEKYLFRAVPTFFPTQAIFHFFRNALVSSYPCYKSWRFREGRTESLLFLNEVIMEAFELRVHLYTLTRLHKKERH